MQEVIETTEKYLAFSGRSCDAQQFVKGIRQAFDGTDMPKVLNDFLFGIEMELQRAGILDENFNEVTE